MPTVKQLLQSLGQEVQVVTTSVPDELLSSAHNKMIGGGYSQLPIVSNGKYYLITIESTLCALASFGASLNSNNIYVRSAMIEITNTHSEDDDIFDVMKDVQNVGAALIVDETGIKNIITYFDTALYFQKWSEDTMHVREVERELKDIINHTFKNDEGIIHQEARQLAVDEVSSSVMFSSQLLIKGMKRLAAVFECDSIDIDYSMFKQAMSKSLIITDYVDENGSNNDCVSADNVKLDQVKKCVHEYAKAVFKTDNLSDTVLKRAFPEIFNDNHSNFESLTLRQYIQIFFKYSWDHVKDLIGHEKNNVEYILNGVRETRNKLAHFHEEEISPQDRRQLRMCNDMLRLTKRALQQN